jgi:hypothetical protein
LAWGRNVDLDWQSSAHCNGGTCIEVAPQDGQVVVRDSGDPDGDWLSFPVGSWHRFTAEVKAGRLDHIG